LPGGLAVENKLSGIVEAKKRGGGTSKYTFARGDMIFLSLRRLATDGADTDPADLLLLGARINYRATGPASPGSGTYDIPNWS
jgi:hypothetical protein